MNTTTHQDILDAVEQYKAEHEKFTVKGVAAAGARARKALGEIGKLTKSRRAEIQEAKNSAKEAKATK
jgi:hypothetical protein